jgi:hypothetical protein
MQPIHGAGLCDPHRKAATLRAYFDAGDFAMELPADVDAAAARLLETYPTMTMGSALHQARVHIEEGCLSAAAAWTRVAAMICDAEALASSPAQIVA